MYLKEGCSLLLKIHKPTRPLVLSSNPNLVPSLNPKPQTEPTQPILAESEVLQRLKHEPQLGLALEYFRSISNSRDFKHTQLTYKAMIEKLGSQCEMDGVQYLMHQMKLEGVSCSEDLFISVVKACRRAGLAEQALKVFYRIREFGYKPSVKIYNHLLDALLCENRFWMINPVYVKMKKDGMVPNVFTYNILLKALCKNDRVDGAHKLLGEMSKGCCPDTVSYTTVVSALCRLGKVDEARELAYKGLDPNVITYWTVISSLSDVWNVESALAVLAKMFVRGCRPNIHTFTSLLKGYFMEGRVSEALDLWNRMVREGFGPNVVAYTTVIHGLCSVGNMCKAVSVLHEMERMGCSPNVTTFSTLIDGFVKAGNLVRASET
ncbi:hypothetical protein ACLB2K_042220 [Fragaria x ananassa]